MSERLVTTRARSLLHVPVCPHLSGDVVDATEEERATLPVCTWCAKEIDGVGRTYYDTLDDALDALGSTSDAKDRTRALLAGVTYDSVWIPGSGTYVALAVGGVAVAWARKTVVYPSRGEAVPLPDYSARSGGGARREEERTGALCTTCFTRKSVTGVCGCS